MQDFIIPLSQIQAMNSRHNKKIMDYTQLTYHTPVEAINEALKNCLVGNLHIRIEKTGDGEVVASMPICPATSRPDGMLHGGASLALAETISGLGSMLIVDMTKFDVRGINVSGSHTGTLKEGRAIAKATIIHRGKTTHIWNVDVKTETGHLISTSRVTNFILKK